MFFGLNWENKLPVVFDNIVFNLQRAGGVSRFWSKIIAPYNNSEKALFIERDGAKKNTYRCGMSLAPKAQDHQLPIKISRYINFSREFFKDEFVFHSSYFRINSTPGCVNITTVHDLIYEKFCQGLGPLLHLRQKAVALRKSDCIVCVSEHTRKDLLEHYPFCADKRVVVIPNGVEGFYKSDGNPDFFQRVGIDDSLPYFLYVGHRGSCKGFGLVHDVIDLMEGSLRCVVVGSPFNKAERAEIFKRGHEKNIINVGKVNDFELNDLYSHANFFFFPSLYEGFGIPPLEAMLSGCPVLASNCSSIPEVVGEAGILFDPADVESLKSGLLCVLQSEVRESLITRGIERAGVYSWESVVERYAALYSELID